MSLTPPPLRSGWVPATTAAAAGMGGAPLPPTPPAGSTLSPCRTPSFRYGSRTVVPLLVASALAACTLFWWVRSADSHALARRDAARGLRSELHVPYVPQPIAIDAELDGKTVWQSEAGSTGNLKDADDRGMVPYTEVKARWDSRTLYLLLYAGDLDLEGSIKDHDGPVSKDDSFHVEIGKGDRVYAIEVSVLGTIADGVCVGASEVPVRLLDSRCALRWESRAIVAVDKDGTLNQLGDNDEERVVEMAIPLETVGLANARAGTEIPFAVRRCDVQKDGPHACAGWGTSKQRGVLVLNPRG